MSVLNLIPNAVGQAEPTQLYGEVSTTYPAPQSFSDPLYVVQPDWNPTAVFTILDWPALYGAALPMPGVECLLEYDNQRNLRCTWWNGVYETSPSIKTAINSISSAYTLGSSDSTVLVTGTTTITLPTAMGVAGLQYTVKNIGSSVVTIVTTSGQTIDGAASLALVSQYEAATVQSDGSNWWVTDLGWSRGSWTSVPLNGGWSSPSGQTAEYRVDGGGVVWLRGKVVGGSGSPFTMPAGSCPGQEMDYVAISDNQYYGKCNIGTNGVATLYMVSPWNSSYAVSLAGMNYLAEN